MDAEALLDIARGPLFALTFLILVLGLARHVIVQSYLLASSEARHHGTQWRRVLGDSAGWLLPVRHLVKGTMLLTAASIGFHVGAIVTMLFFEGHVALWESWLAIDLPAVGANVADGLTLLTIVSGLALLGYRAVVPRARQLSGGKDFAVLVVTLLPFVTGYLAAHPSWSPIPWTHTLVIHVLSGELLFITVPFSKLAHMVLFPFVRISPVYWHLQPGAGAEAAQTVAGRMERSA